MSAKNEQNIADELAALEGKLSCANSYRELSLQEKTSLWMQFFPGISPKELYEPLQKMKFTDYPPKVDIAFEDADLLTASLSLHFPLGDPKRSYSPIGMSLDIAKETVKIRGVDIVPKMHDKGCAKKLLHWLYDFAAQTGKSALTLTACRTNGGYTWARFGFTPHDSEWAKLKKYILDHRLNKDISSINFANPLPSSFDSPLGDSSPYIVKYNNGFALTDDETRVIKEVLASDDPQEIWRLSDLGRELACTNKEPKHSVTVGKAILCGLAWKGKLPLTPGTPSMDRFSAYINRAPEIADNLEKSR